MTKRRILSWFLGILLVLFLVGVPYGYYRYVYTFGKRLREVVPGRVYRSGSMTADGFRYAVQRYGIRTIFNLQDEAPDPLIPQNFFGQDFIRESDLCRELNVRYIYLPPKLLKPGEVPPKRPPSIDQFLQIMDDPDNYPVLIHCRAGLHRTGCLVAVYRMEYQGWTAAEAIRELKGHGFGEFVSGSSNDYIVQYILAFTPGERRLVEQGVARGE